MPQLRYLNAVLLDFVIDELDEASVQIKISDN